MKKWRLQTNPRKNESHYKMHFGSRCLLLSDYLIVVCVLLELAILISRLLPATRGACNPNLHVATTHAQYVCLVWTSTKTK